MQVSRRSIRRHIVGFLALVCAGVLALSLVRPSQDAARLRTEAHAVQLAAATVHPAPIANVIGQHRNTDQPAPTPTASALPSVVGYVAFYLVAFSPLIVGLVVCALCVAAVYAVNFTALILGELVYRVRRLPPIAPSTKASAARAEPRYTAGSKRPSRGPTPAKPARVAAPGKPGAKKASATQAHSARP